MSYDSINLDPPRGERVALPVGKYGNSQTPELRIVSYIGSKPTKTDGLNRHSFLVAHNNGVNGTSFMAIQVKEVWLTPAACALAFGDQENDTPADTGASASEIKSMHRTFLAEAAQRAAANNTPAEQMESATETAYNNLLTQIRINVGSILRLQDWAGVERNPQGAWDALVGTEFAGTIVPGTGGNTTEVKSVYSRKRTKQT